MLTHERKGRLLIKLALTDEESRQGLLFPDADQQQMEESLKSRALPQVIKPAEEKKVPTVSKAGQRRARNKKVWATWDKGTRTKMKAHFTQKYKARREKTWSPGVASTWLNEYRRILGRKPRSMPKGPSAPRRARGPSAPTERFRGSSIKSGPGAALRVAGVKVLRNIPSLEPGSKLLSPKWTPAWKRENRAIDWVYKPEEKRLREELFTRPGPNLARRKRALDILKLTEKGSKDFLAKNTPLNVNKLLAGMKKVEPTSARAGRLFDRIGTGRGQREALAEKSKSWESPGKSAPKTNRKNRFAGIGFKGDFKGDFKGY